MATDETAKTRLRLWLRLLKVSRHAENELRQSLRQEFATTLPRFDVMAALERFPEGLKMSELSGELMVSNGNVTGIVDRLVTDGTVERVAVDGDRRASRVKLTKTGLGEFTRQANAHGGWVDRIFAKMDADSAKTVTELLEKVNFAEAGKGHNL